MRWNNFLLRSYDPQTGRWLQNDPFDQFASGYVGVGADPVNNVDPTGGNVPGIGCPSVAGMVGYGGMASQLSSGAGMLSTIATVSGVASSGMKIAELANKIGQSNRIAGAVASNSESSVLNAGMPGEEQGGKETKEPCNCPPGYGPKPKPGGDQHPYFSDPDYAAKHWTQNILPIAKGARNREQSSLLFSVESKGVTMYSYSIPASFPPGSGYPPNQSPGYAPIHRKYHENLPGYTNVIGHLHFHNLGSVNPFDALTLQNKKFSEADGNYLMRGFSNFAYFYVLGGTGQLWGSYPMDIPLKKYEGGYSPDERAGDKLQVKSGYYDNVVKADAPCSCYKQ